MGVPGAIKTACSAAIVGKLLPTDLYVHRSAEDELPALVRILVLAARRLVGELTYDVVKVALDGRAVSFLSYERFDELAHPPLTRSVRVYLPKASWDVRDYETSANPPILHRKDALVTESYPLYAAFRALTESEERLELLGGSEIGFQSAWEALLASRGLVIEGHEIRQRS
jgi:DNA phosphorothioation-associated putative methyltransferase